jgi:hypothetical protein
MKMLFKAEILTIICIYIATCIPIAKQRFGKHIPAKITHATEGRLLLDNGAANTPSQEQRKRRFLSVRLEVIQGRSHADRIGIGSSSGDGSRRWLRRNGKEGTRLCQENVMCELKWEWACDKSVARIRLVKTENPSVRVSVNCKVCNQCWRCVACSSELCECIRCNKSNYKSPLDVLIYTECPRRKGQYGGKS